MRVFFSLLLVSLMSSSVSAAEVENIQQNIRALGFDRYYGKIGREDRFKRVKIAIFDYGFGNYEKEKGLTIPENTIYKKRPDDKSVDDTKNTHGLVMAQIITQYATNDYDRWTYVPQIYLYKSDGYTNMEWAINDAIKNGIDVILHSIVIEYGSNYDGSGFYNSLVNRAANAGIVWVNAAGNFGLTTYNSKVNLSDNNWVNFSDLENNALPVKCDTSQSKKQNKKCKIRLVLAWDDFKNQPLIGSTKDLDLYLYDSNFETTVSSAMTQIDYDDKRSGNAGTTLYPREIIETQIPDGISYIKVRAKHNNFSSSDNLRITADGDNISFPVRDEGETLLNPADNPNVITVGEDSKRSSVSRSLNKPELVAPSLVIGDDGKRYRGSSNAAAVVAAGVALMKTLNPDLDREGILDLASNTQRHDVETYPTYPRELQRPMVPNTPYIPGFVPQELNPSFKQSSRPEDGYPPQGAPSNLYAVPLSELRFGPPPGMGCFPLVDVGAVDPCTITDFLIKSRSVLVQTSHGIKIATTFDPIVLVKDWNTGGVDQRANYSDVIGILPGLLPDRAFVRLDRHRPTPPQFNGMIEIFQLPIATTVCKLPDWGFMSRQRDMARDQVYMSQNQGARNTPLPPTCSPQYVAQGGYPVSDWSMYPSLRQVPYVAPVGPVPLGLDGAQSNYNNAYGSDPRQQYNNQQGQSFQMPSPSSVKEN